MASVITSRRVPWVALALSFLSAGVGHLYCGRIAKGLPLYFAWLLVPLGITIAALLPPSPTSFVLLVLLPVVIVFIVYLYAAIDAWRLAYQIGSGYSLRDYNRAGDLLAAHCRPDGLRNRPDSRSARFRLRSVCDSKQQHESDHPSRRPLPGKKAVDARSRSQTRRLDRVSQSNADRGH